MSRVTVPPTLQPKVGVTRRDEMEVVFHTPLNPAQLLELRDIITDASQDGYTLERVQSINAHLHQRADPQMVGARLLFKR